MAGEGKLEIQQLQEGGFSDTQIQDWMATTRSELSEGGFPQQAIDEYFGIKAFDPKPIEVDLSKNLDESGAFTRAKELLSSTQEGAPEMEFHGAPAPKNAETKGEAPRQADSIIQALEAGLKFSTSGLQYTGKLPDIDVDENADWYMRIAKQMGMVVGDVPAMALGGLLASPTGMIGGPAAPLTTVVAAGAGANALPTLLREWMMDKYQNGEVTDFKDFWTRTVPIFLNTMKSAVVGGATMGVGGKVAGAMSKSAPLLRTTGKMASEITTMVGVGRALEGQAPQLQDFTDAAILVAGLGGTTKMVGSATGKLRNVFRKTGMKPIDVAKQALNDPVLRQELLADGDFVPPSYEGFVDPAAKVDTVRFPTPEGDIVVQQRPPLDVRKAIGATDGDVVLYQGVRSGNLDGAQGKSGWWTADPKEAAGYAAKDGPGGKIKVATAKDFPEGTFSDAEGNPVTPEKFLETTSKVGTSLPDEVKVRGTFSPDDFGPSAIDTPKDALLAFLKEETGAGALERKKAPVRTEAEKTVLARIGKVPEEGFKPDWNKAYTDAFDRYHPIAEYVRAVTGGKEVKAGSDPYKQARLNQGNAGRATYMLEYGVYNFKTLVDAEGVKPLKQILKPIADDLDGWRAYGIAKRSMLKESQGIKTGVDLEAAKQVVADGKAKYGPVDSEIVKYREAQLQYLVDAEVLSPEQLAKYKLTDPEYSTPFHRILEDRVGGKSLGKGGDVANPIKQMKGSEALLVDPIESLIKDTFVFVEMAERNRVLRSVVKLGEKYGVGPELLEKVKTPVKPIDVLPEEIARFNKEFGMDSEVAGQAMTVFRPLRQDLAPDQIAVFEKGKRQVYKVPEALAESLKNMDETSAGLLIKILAGPVKTLKLGTTMLPEFAMKNMIRDQAGAFIFSQNGYLPVVDFVRGVGEQIAGGETMKAWLKGGGAQATFMSLDRNYINENVMRLEPTQSVLKQVRNYVGSPYQALRMLNDGAENATRLGEMRKGLKGKKGTRSDIFEAAYQSREVTLDFQRMGRVTRAANQAVAFQNPQLQGIDRTRRAFKDDPMGTTIRVAAAVTVPSVLMWLNNNSDPRYAEVPDWQKDHFWIVMRDNWVDCTADQAAAQGEAFARQTKDGRWQLNEGNIYRIPKPQEIGLLFGTSVERMLDFAKTHDPKAFEGFSESVFDAIMPSITPNAAIPFIETMNNRSMFTGAPVVPGHLEKALPEVQYSAYTSETAKMLGRVIPPIPMGKLNTSSPMVIENWVRSWTGGLGMYAMQAAEWGLVKSGQVVPPPKPLATLADMPVVKAFVVRFPTANAQSIVDFHNEFLKHEEVINAIEVSRSRGDFATMAKLIGDPKNEDKLMSLQGLNKVIGEMRRTVELINFDKEQYTPLEKRQLIDGLYFGMIQTARLGNQLVKEIKGK